MPFNPFFPSPLTFHLRVVLLFTPKTPFNSHLKKKKKKNPLILCVYIN